MTVRLRLTIWYALAASASLLVAGLLVWFQYGSALRSGLDELLRTQANAAIDILESNLAARLDNPVPGSGIFVIEFDATDRPIHATAGAPTIVRPPSGLSTINGQGLSELAVYAGDGPRGTVIVAGASLGEMQANLGGLARAMLAVGLAGAALSALGGWWFSGRALAPVARLTSEADAIGLGDLDKRLPEPATTDEMARLARTLNRMLERVEAAVRRQRIFVAGASHDLRTPITALRVELELALMHPSDARALREAVEAAHADAVRLGHLTQQLLHLAEADPDGRPMYREEVRLDELVNDGVELAHPAADGRVLVDIRTPAASVWVDRTRCIQAIVNLVSNALRYSPEGERAEVVAGLDGTGARGHRTLIIEVLDRGPGVSDDVRTSLFEPFARGRNVASPGSGLGLATAAAAVRAHRGEIGFEDRPDGGSRFWLRIPA